MIRIDSRWKEEIVHKQEETRRQVRNKILRQEGNTPRNEKGSDKMRQKEKEREKVRREENKETYQTTRRDNMRKDGEEKTKR